MSTSFFGQGLPDLNRRLILPAWSRSFPRLAFSVSLLFHFFSACSSLTFLQVWGMLPDRRSADCWLTAANLPSSSSATVKFLQFITPAETKWRNAYALRERQRLCRTHPIHPRREQELGLPGGLPPVDPPGMFPYPGSAFPLRPSWRRAAVARLTNL